MVGDKSNNFNNKGIVSDKALATVLLRVLEYPETEFTWKTAVDVLKTKTGIEIAGDKLTRGEAFEAIWKAVSTPVMFVKDGEAPKYLGVEVGKLDIAIITPPVKDLAIDSVSADNLKEIKVNFNQQVNKDKLGTFSIKGTEVVEAVVQEDGMTVVLNLKDALKEKEHTLTVENTEAVEEKAGKLAKTEMKFTVVDKELPRVTGIEFTGPKSLTITFNEPIKNTATGKVTVKQGQSTLAANLAKIEYEGRKLIVPLFANLQEDKEYTISVSQFKDYKDLPNIDAEEKLVFKKNTESPKVVISDVTQQSMVVTFSMPVTGLKASRFHHSFTMYEAKKVKDMDGNDVNDAKPYSKVKVVFHENGDTDKKYQPIAAGNVKIMIDGDAIKSLWGVKLGNFEETYAVTVDDKKPEVESATLTTETTITVVFTKDVVVDTKKSFSVIDEDKNNDFVSATKVNGKKYTVTFKSGNAGKDVTLKITDVKDTTVNKNKLDDYAEVISVMDKRRPIVDKVTYHEGQYDADGNVVDGKVGKIYVFFNEDVDGATALKVSNYQVLAGGSYVRLTGSADFFDGSKIAMIELSKAENTKFKNSAELYVENVTDIAGNKIIAKAYPTVAHGTEMALKIEKITLTDAKTLKVEFNQELRAFDNSKDVIFKQGSAGAAPAGTAPKGKITEINGKVATVTLDKSVLKTTAVIGALDHNLKFAAKTSQSNIIEIAAQAVQGQFNDTMNAAPLESPATVYIEDAVSPAIVKKDGVAQVKFDHFEKSVVIPFDRALAAATSEQISNDIIVEINGVRIDHASGDYTFSIVTVGVENNTGIQLIFGGDKEETTGDLVIKTASGLSYLYADNSSVDEDYLTAFTFSKDGLDFAGPVVTNATIDGTKVVLTLDNELYLIDVSDKSKTEVADSTDIKDYLDKTGAFTINSAIYKKDSKTIEITLSAAPAAGNVIKFVLHDTDKHLTDDLGNIVNEAATGVLKFKSATEFDVLDK